MITDIDEIARTVFGIKRLHTLQRTVIANILRGERQLVLLPTGYGKSLCFLVPALMLDGATLVVYPLLALMADQQRRMESVGIRAVVLKGGQTHAQRRQALDAVRTGTAQVVLTNPETLQDERLVTELSHCRLAHIAVDEAHCVSEWGESFRPAYRRLGNVIQRLGVQRVTAFTATAGPIVQERIQTLLFGESADGTTVKVIQGAFDRENLRYRVQYASDKQRALLHLTLTMPKPMLVFCGTRRGAEDTARLLAAFFSDQARLRTPETTTVPVSPTPVRFYHAALTKQEKAAVERWFFKSSDGVLCATCAYGMGVDKPDIRSCIHLDAPGKIEFFIQEAGRAGRNGEAATSVLLWNDGDKRRAPALAGYAESTTCRRQYLLDYLHGEQTICSGCDRCDAAQKAISATALLPDDSHVPSDDALVLRWVRAHRRTYTAQDSLPLILDALNAHDRAALGMNVWDVKAVHSLTARLLDAQRIRLVGLGTREHARLDLTRTQWTVPPARTAATLLRRHRRRLHRLRHQYRRLARVLARRQRFS